LGEGIEFSSFRGREVALDPFKVNLWSELFHIDSHFMLRAKNVQSETIGMREVKPQGRNVCRRSERRLSMWRRLNEYILWCFAKIPTEYLTKDCPTYYEMVTVPYKREPCDALLLTK
jgi:hypothetical protein